MKLEMKFDENLFYGILNISYSWVKHIQIYYIIRLSRGCLPVEFTKHLVQISLFEVCTLNSYIPGV